MDFPSPFQVICLLFELSQQTPNAKKINDLFFARKFSNLIMQIFRRFHFKDQHVKLKYGCDICIVVQSYVWILCFYCNFS